MLEVGIERFTVDQVIEKAGIGKGTVYKYYRNKDQMLVDLVVKALELLLTGFQEVTEEKEHHLDKIKALIQSCYAYYQTYPKYFELISYMERPEFDIDEANYLAVSHRLQAFTHNLVLEGQQKGHINPSLDTAMSHYILWACCVAVVEFVEAKKKLLKDHHEIDRHAMVDTFAEVFTQGMGV